MLKIAINQWLDACDDESLVSTVNEFVSPQDIISNPLGALCLMMELNRRLINLRSDYDGLAEETSESVLQKKVEELEQQLIDAENEVSSLEGEVSSLEEELAELRERNED